MPLKGRVSFAGNLRIKATFSCFATRLCSSPRCAPGFPHLSLTRALPPFGVRSVTNSFGFPHLVFKTRLIRKTLPIVVWDFSFKSKQLDCYCFKKLRECETCLFMKQKRPANNLPGVPLTRDFA